MTSFILGWPVHASFIFHRLKQPTGTLTTGELREKRMKCSEYGYKRHNENFIDNRAPRGKCSLPSWVDRSIRPAISGAAFSVRGPIFSRLPRTFAYCLSNTTLRSRMAKERNNFDKRTPSAILRRDWSGQAVTFRGTSRRRGKKPSFIIELATFHRSIPGRWMREIILGSDTSFTTEFVYF